MTGRRPSAGILVLAAYLALCAFMMRSAQAQDAGQANRTIADPQHFSLPAQPLAAALQTLGHMTDLSVLVSTDAGIATLQSVPGVSPGTVNLIAPRGTVDTGDAGIRAGNLNMDFPPDAMRFLS
jgi:Filamentous haemagglutinin family outer membrane protein